MDEQEENTIMSGEPNTDNSNLVNQPGLELSAPPISDIEKKETNNTEPNEINESKSQPSHQYHEMKPTAKPGLSSPTMFGEVLERCVSFCIDTSGSMFSKLDSVKEHLMETLRGLAMRSDNPMFNLIEFNSEVTQWADKMVQCTKETVAVAENWVSKLSAKTGTNTQDALLTALADSNCQAIYLVSDGLPDQYAEDVLDAVLGSCGNRRFHCIYVAGEKADVAATEFMEDLAAESFGSFHIVTMTTHGCVEKITPVYRADHSRDKIVPTVNNTLRPNIKTCGVSTTLQVDPEEFIGYGARVPVVYPGFPYLLPSAPPAAPHRYYYPYYWSRYRPAKSYLKAADRLEDSYSFGLSPSAGSLLVGKKVIARRIEDGLFYRATVQSQNLGDKFLIAFGPSKHGKYKQTEYQDTEVFDIIDYFDALRHTIIPGDTVLAPWEPEGEKFAPGVVLEGREKRHAEGPPDQQLTVNFSNGITEKIVPERAVWIPRPLYDRLSLELKMPKEARASLLTNADLYPLENLPGYPTSGSIAEPANYPVADPLIIESNPHLWDPLLYKYPPYLPAFYGYPHFVLSRKETREAKNEDSICDDNSNVIPGTNMTKKELDDRVMSQLFEHNMVINENNSENRKTIEKNESQQQPAIGHSPSRLLDKREKRIDQGLKKSVTFERNLEKQSEKENIYLKDENFDQYGNPIDTSDVGVNTDSSLLFYRSPGIKNRPKWSYWKHEHCDNNSRYELASANLGNRSSKNDGAFRETALQAPLEARDQRQPYYGVEWTSPTFRFVDYMAKYDSSNSVEECLSVKKAAQLTGNGVTRSYTLGQVPFASMSPEEREEARRALRRKRVEHRQKEWDNRLHEGNRMKELMQDNHRQRILDQMNRDRHRQIKEQQDICRAREAKKQISSELRQRIEANQKEEQEKEIRRIEALTKRRERREEIQAQREREIARCEERREYIRKQNNENRLQARTDQLNSEEEKQSALAKQHQNAKLRRIDHWRQLEKQGQEKKDLRLAVTEQQQALYRSQIFA